MSAIATSSSNYPGGVKMQGRIRGLLRDAGAGVPLQSLWPEKMHNAAETSLKKCESVACQGLHLCRVFDVLALG